MATQVGEIQYAASRIAALVRRLAMPPRRRAGLSTRAVLRRAWAPPRNPLCELPHAQPAAERTDPASNRLVSTGLKPGHKPTSMTRKSRVGYNTIAKVSEPRP